MTREVRLTLIGVLTGLFLAALDQTVTATSLPQTLTDLGGRNWYGWVGALYLLGSTIAAPIAGRLTEIISRREVLIGALGLFGVGSFMCGASIHFSQLLMFRFIQGLGGGALFSLAFTTLAWFFPPRERSRWAGLIGALFGVAGALGPLLGGLITENIGWRWIFWVNLPFLLFAITFVYRFFPLQKASEKTPMDIKGALLMALWTTPLLLAFLFWGPKRLGSPVWGLILLGISILLLRSWIRVERHQAAPLFDLRLVEIPTFRYAALAAFFFGAIFLAGVTFFPLYLQGVLGYSPRQSGMLLLAFTVGAVLSTGATGAWVSRHGRYKPILLGSAIALTLTFSLVAIFLPSQISVYALLAGMVGIALLLGPFQALLSVVGQNDIPQPRIGSATSAIQFMRQVGSTVGLAVVNMLYAANLYASIPPSEALLKGIQGVVWGMAGLGSLLCGAVFLLPDRLLSRTHSSVRA